MRVVLFAVAFAALRPAFSQPPSRLVRELTIDDSKTPDGFTRIGAIAIGPNKDIFVEQPQDNVVLRFDANGGFVRSIGGKGSGPGETESLGGIGFVGDTLWTHDWRAGRFAFFSSDGTYSSTMSPPNIIDSLNARGVRLSASTPLSNGTFYYGMYSYASFTELTLLAPVAQVVATRDGKRVRVVAMTDSLGRGAYGVTAGNRSTFTSDPMFGALVAMNTVAAVGGGGSWFAVARREECATKSQYTVARTTLAGDTTWKTRIACPRVAVPSGFIDSIVAVNRDRILKVIPVDPKYAEAQIRGKLRMSGFTPARGLQVGGDGSIWIRPFTSIGDSVETWVRADAKSGAPARFSLPARAQLKAIVDGTHIWVMELDADDLPRLVRYRVE